MPFDRGRVSFQRLRVQGPTPSMLKAEHLEALEAGVFSSPEDDARIGPIPEIEAGWVGGTHLFDDRFTPEKNILLNGRCAHFALRIDTNKVPAEIKRAIKAQHQSALEDTPGTKGRSARRELREMVDEAMRAELSTGRHRRSTLLPTLWDAERDVLLCASGSNSVTENLCEHWRTAPGGGLEPQSAGTICTHFAQSTGRLRDFEDLTPSRFTTPPTGEDRATPETPWSAGGPEPHDFVGNEFLIWLWHRCDTGAGVFEVPTGSATSGDPTASPARTTEVAVALTDAIESSCAWGYTGTQVLKASPGGPAPARLPEAAHALARGKWPRKLGLTLASEGRQWAFSLAGDRWLVTGCELPKPAEELVLARDALEDRVEATLELDALLVSLLHRFLEDRLSDSWPASVGAIGSWVRSRCGLSSRDQASANTAEAVA